MIGIKSSGTCTGAGVLTAIAASLCCLTPVIALLAGSSIIASGFSWIEPVRPYLIGLSCAVLAFAWYIKLKPARAKDMNCNCGKAKKTSFLQSKTFLGIVTVFAVLMMTFPLYAKIFYPGPQAAKVVAVGKNNIVTAEFKIKGMTCEGCTEHINNVLSKTAGVIKFNTSYKYGNSIVRFDNSKTSADSLVSVINKTGYKVIYQSVINN